MDIEFNSEKELYNHLKPALTTKVNELKRNNLDYIKIEDIWNFLKIKKWSKSNDLQLYQMVDDIINVDNILLDNYVKDEIKKKKIEPILKDEDDK